jgi:uncharacterized membrane-anchored protein
MTRPTDQTERYALANELHARPFPEIPGPCRAIYLALTLPDGGRAARGDLDALLDRFGADRPAADANHFHGAVGARRLKWELHSEFVTYTMFLDGVAETPFSTGFEAAFPEEWLAGLHGQTITAARVRIERVAAEAEVEARLDNEVRGWFVGESLAAAYVLDRNAVVAGDFRIDTGGFVRFAVFGIGGVGARRMGRVVQRLLEIETYKSMAMLTLPLARRTFAEAGVLDTELSAVAANMADKGADAGTMLDRLLDVSARIGAAGAASAFRFSAGRAYRAIVDQRIHVLREERVLERQLFSEFMMRRFEPAMRTCEAAEKRLDDLSERAARAAELLATRVGVDAAEQNRKLLESMNRRAALQMRLQETVEGLSVVAVSYYAVNLAAYLVAPFAKDHLDKTWLSALLVPPVLAVVWLMIRRIRAHAGAAFEGR